MIQLDFGSQSRTKNPAPMSSEISDLLLFVSYFAYPSKRLKFGVYFFNVCCVN